MKNPIPVLGPLQMEIQSFLEELVSEGRERGIQVAAYHEGRLVVDAWAGCADGSTGCPVHGETLFPVFSVTKGIAATVLHLLVERGKLGYDDRIADFWPEFGNRGKEAITVRQGLDHSAGIPLMPVGIGDLELGDWDAICRAIAALEPIWPPGSRVEYHAMTYGWIVGELARRVDGRPFSQLVREEIALPLGIGDALYMGVPEGVEPEIAVIEEPEAAIPVPTGKPEAVPSWLGPLHAMMNRPDVQRACIPASNGIMNARAIARHYAALLPGGVDGVELLPESRIREATRLWRPDEARSMGYVCLSPPMGDASSFGHGGYGGSRGFAELNHRFALGITKNLFSKGNAVPEIVERLRRSLGIELS